MIIHSDYLIVQSDEGGGLKLLGKKIVNIVISKECIVWILLVLWYSELVGANRSLEELILLAMWLNNNPHKT